MARQYPSAGREAASSSVSPCAFGRGRSPERDFLADALELRLRDNVLLLEDGRGRHVQPGQFVNVRVLEAEDIVVLYVVALTIEQGGLLRLSEPDRGLSRISDVPASLGRLRRNQLIEAERDGNAWRVRWGKRALDIARSAGVDVTAA